MLKLRPPELPPPIQMCDALSRNVPKLAATVQANCNAHYLESIFIWSECTIGALAGRRKWGEWNAHSR